MTSPPFQPPQRLARAAGERCGAAGREWLARLPELVAAALERWELSPVRVVRPGGARSLVVLVSTADGTPAALKVSPGDRVADAEGAALERWDGHGAVRLLRSAPREGLLLLERLRGEVTLRSLPEAGASLEAVALLRRLWVPPGGAAARLESVADRTARQAALLRDTLREPWAREAVACGEEALEERERLVAGPPAGGAVLLHGEFRQGAVLAGAREPWLAVGPDPLTGEAAYDLAWPARDRLDTLMAGSSSRAAARRRLASLADALEVDAGRLRGWTVFRCVEAGVRALRAGARDRAELLLEFAAQV